MPWDLNGNSGTNPDNDFLGTTDDQPLVVKTNGSERMRIIPDGKVGIGTNTPDKKLCVQEATSSFRFGHEGGPAVLRVENSDAGSLAALNLGNNARNWQLRVEGTDGNKFKIFDATAIADRLTIDTSGNVGVGTTNPARTLEIAASTGSTELVIRDNSRPLDQRVWRLMNNTQVLSIEAVNDALTGGTNVINFTRAGNVGIGTKTPVAKLHLEGGGIRWGNGSVLTTDQGGSIELGGDNVTPGAGTPYIDFHFRGITQDFNARIINDGDRRLSIDTGTLRVGGFVQSTTGGFQFPDGTVQATATLRGPQGPQGPQGPPGPAVSTSAVCVSGIPVLGGGRTCSCSGKTVSVVSSPCKVTSNTGSCEAISNFFQGVEQRGQCCVCAPS